jgi:hypothetical protein
VRVLDDEKLVGPLQQLIYRSAHGRLDDLAQLLGVHAGLAADEQRPASTLVVGCQRDELENPLDVALPEACLEQPIGRLLANESLGAGARVDPIRLDADHATDCSLGGRGDPHQSQQRLSREVGHRGSPLDRVAGSDPCLGCYGALALDDLRGDVRGELLDEEGLLEDNVLDHFLEELWEARHMDALLGGVEIDRALDLRGDQLLHVAVADSDRFRDADDSGARQTEPDLGLRSLQVLTKDVTEIGHLDGIMAVATNAAT